MSSKKSKKNKKSTINKLYLDRPTSHGGWPHGHSGGYVDSKKPVYKQIGDYLKSMGLLDDDNPRAVLSEKFIRSLIRESIRRRL